MAGDDSDSDDILMSEDATNWMSVGKGVNPLAEIARITGRTPRTEDRKRNATNAPANTESTIPARPAFTPAAAPAASAASSVARTPRTPRTPAASAAGSNNLGGGADNSDDDVEVTGASEFRGALNDYPHARSLCQSLGSGRR